MLGFDEFVKVHLENNSDKCLDVGECERVRKTDEQVKALMFKCYGCGNPTEFLRLADSNKEDYVLEIYFNGASIRQISRLTGVSKGLVEKWLR